MSGSALRGNEIKRRLFKNVLSYSRALPIIVLAIFILMNSLNSLPQLFRVLTLTPVVFFLPGYLLLNMSKIVGENLLDTLLLAFLLSYLINIPILLLARLLPLDPKALLSATFLAISLTCLYMEIRNDKRQRLFLRSKKGLKHHARLVFCILFMATTLALLYPSMLKVTNLDIVRHYKSAVRYYEGLSYYGSIYPLYYVPVSILIVWTEASAEATFTALAFLYLLLPLSYYLFVR